MRLLAMSFVIASAVVSSAAAGDHHNPEKSNCWNVLWGPMPQTCYAPRYGCYGASERYTHRYPAYHGNLYSRAYNYRKYFDYPVHAATHEPTSLFSYDTQDDRAQGAASPLPQPGYVVPPVVIPPAVIPTPAPSPADPRSSTKRSVLRPATVQATYEQLD